jgi:mono/diheme cytochrome c family protein
VWPALSAVGLAAGLTIVAVSVGAVQGPPASPKQPDTVAAARGKVIYQRYCGSCHGPNGTGDGPMARDLRVPPADLTQLAATNDGVFPFDEVVRSIDGRRKTRAHGSPDMPVWGEVFAKTAGTDAPNAETAITRLAHFIWTIQKPAPK